MTPLLYWVIWLAGPWWWLAAAGVFFVVTVIAGQLLPVVVLPLFYKIERLDNAELTERMARLASGTGLSIQGVYRMGLSEETAKANAMLAGLGRTRRVLMGDTLLDQFSSDEIEVIFAHEIGHHVFRHIRKMIVAGSAVQPARILDLRPGVGLVACSPLRPRVDAHADACQHVAAVDAGADHVLAGAGTAAKHHQPSLRAAVRPLRAARTGMRQAYVSAFRKLARLNKDDPDPHPLEVFLFHSHPPISERRQDGR